MARISEEAIERIKREVSVADLARQRGVQLRGHGENLIGLCPFHDDHEPSLVITPAKNLWNCLGACQKGGDVIRWVEIAERVPFRRAVEILHGGFPLAAPLSAPAASCPVSPSMNDRELLAAVVGYYQARLNTTDAPEAVRYLERRGIWSEEAVAHFSIGFSDRSIGGLLPNPDLKPGKEIRARLAEVGIYRADTGREHFNGCMVFPVVGRGGEVLEIYGRKIRDDMRHRVGSHLYLPGPHRGIWNGEVLTESKEIILCESIIDALTFWLHGFRNVVPAFGVNGFTEEMFEAMRACGTTRVLIAYDRDEAGDAAAAKLAVRLGAASMACYRVLFPRMMDANDYAKKVQPAAQSLGVLLRSAEWMSGPRVGVVAMPEAPAGEPVVVAPAAPTLRRAEQEQTLGIDAPDIDVLSLAAELPVLPAPPVSVNAPANLASIDITCGDRNYRIRGLDKSLSYAQMKVLVRVSHAERVFVDQVDLVSARQRAQFVKQSAIDLGTKEEIVKNDLAAVYRELEVLQEKLISETLEPKEKGRPPMSEDDLEEAMTLLRAPDLLQRVLSDYERCGVVGERTNKLVAFIAAVSRLLDDPLAIIIQSSSAAGKTKLMDAVLDFIPEEERIRYSAMTGQSLFYFEATSLKHKILAVSEEEGAERASYALKLLQSEGQLTIASTGKDPQSGRLVTNEYHVEGPVMIFLTTTSVEIDEELLNRCIVLSVDEERAQTRAIHQLQRRAETLDGLLARHDRTKILRLHRNAQRLLRPVRVVNNYAPRLTFLDGRTRTRRDHMKYLTLIRTIALLHQHQRQRKSVMHRGERIEYIEVTPADIEMANDLAHEVLGRSLDELAPQTRRMLGLLDGLVASECARLAVQRADYRFTNRRIRELTGWTDFQVRTHLHKLIAFEYVLVHRGGRGQSFVYELLYDGQGKAGRPFLPGLIDVATLTNHEGPQANPEHLNGENEQGTSPQRAPIEVGASVAEIAGKSSESGELRRARVYTLKSAHLDRAPQPAPRRVVEGRDA
ncbi:MAG: CHC2 zinc finger domain-containing protein [Acidobacteriota bacterium]